MRSLLFRNIFVVCVVVVFSSVEITALPLNYEEAMQEIVNHGLNKFRIDTDGFFNQYSTEEVELGSEAELLELTNTFIGKSGNFEVDLGGFFNEYYSKSEEVDQVEFGREIFE